MGESLKHNPFTEKLQGIKVEEEAEKILPSGEYKLSVKFVNWHGQETEMLIKDKIAIKDEDIIEVEDRITSDLDTFGLHNTNMDKRKEKYPDGHPVSIIIASIEDPEIKHIFIRKFNASGNVVEEDK